MPVTSYYCEIAPRPASPVELFLYCLMYFRPHRLHAVHEM